jgi:hypothetical protein
MLLSCQGLFLERLYESPGLVGVVCLIAVDTAMNELRGRIN